MKYKKLTVLCFAILSVFVTCLTVRAEAKDKIKQIGNFKYTYMDYSSKEIWIIQIDPVSTKGIKTLNIPSSIGGKKVVKLGWKYDSDEYGSDHNIFGFWCAEEDGKWRPSDRIKRVKQIKKIVLPDTVKEVTPHCFTNIQNGKCINVPRRVTKNVRGFCEVKWKQLSISPKNKKYEIKKGLLLSKNGEFVYGSVKSMKKIIVPDGVKTIKKGSVFYDKNTIDKKGKEKVTDFYIPSSVNKIGFQSLFFEKTVKFHVAAENKHYADVNGSIYSKKSGRLVAASVKGSTFRVPSRVKVLSKTNFAGGSVKKFVIPASVKKIDSFWCPYWENIVYVFRSKTPPVIEKGFATEGITFYVPKGTKKAYQKAVKETTDSYGEVKIYEV